MRRLRAFTVAVLVPLCPTSVRADQRSDDPAGRRAIRGTPVETAQESEELRALRVFDEESFPKAPLYAPVESAVAQNDDGPPAPAPIPHVSTETPPTDLISPHPTAPSSEPAQLAVPWLATLAVPDLPVRWDPRVVRYLEFYKNDKRGHAIMTSWLRKQGRFKNLISEALRRAKLPQALLYVAMIESGFDPNDRSSAGAVGLWQFMSEGGRIYGLRVDHWIDERKDPEKATDAAMRYLGDLHARFGSWHLALAAFNAGYGAVLRAIAKYNTNDYWELCRHEDGLPWETTLYVPKALAAAIVSANLHTFGYDDVAPDAPYEYDRVLVPSSTSFAAIAKAAGVSVEQVAALNPELRRGRTPPEAWQARVPRGSGTKFAAAFFKVREHVLPHVVRFGEGLDDIAREAGASGHELRRLNGIEETAEVRPGLTLVVPEGRKPLPLPLDEAVAVVAVPDKDRVVPGKKRLFYRVLPGDSVADVASFFKVSAVDVARWNNLDSDAHLTSKMVLQIWAATDFDASRAALLDPSRVKLVTVGSDEFLDIQEARKGRKRVAYVVKHGETLKQIGARFHLSEGDLERINRLGRKNDLLAGQKLTVYVPMSAAERAAAEKALLASVSDVAVPSKSDVDKHEKDVDEEVDESDHEVAHDNVNVRDQKVSEEMQRDIDAELPHLPPPASPEPQP